MIKKRPNREVLRYLYLEEQLGPRNIGRMFGVKKEVVHQWLVYYNIPRLGMKRSAQIRVDRSLSVNGVIQDYDPYKDEPYHLLDFRDMILLEEQGRLTKVW